jgi:hypothetical protein
MEGVAGSIPAPPTICINGLALIACERAHVLPKKSLGGDPHLVRDEGVAGSNPAAPTNFLKTATTTGPDMGNETPCQRSSSLSQLRPQPTTNFPDRPLARNSRCGFQRGHVRKFRKDGRTEAHQMKRGEANPTTHHTATSPKTPYVYREELGHRHCAASNRNLWVVQACSGVHANPLRLAPRQAPSTDRAKEMCQ